MERENDYGSIRIDAERKKIAKTTKNISYTKSFKPVAYSTLILLVVSFGVLVVYRGPCLCTKYQELSKSLQRVLDGKFHRLMARELVGGQGDKLKLHKVSPGRPLLTSFEKSIWEVRYPLAYKMIPEVLKEAIVVTEDKSFFSHHGIDLRGIVRAVLVNIRHRKIVQGGSTITQQLVKTLVGRTGRDFSAKLEETLLALCIDFFYSKDEIFEAYCNTIYMGRVGPFAIHGMQAAARHLLQKEVAELTTKDCALLAGLIRSPNPHSPLRHPERAVSRANTVRQQMRKFSGQPGELKAQPYALNYLDLQSPELLPLAWYYQQVQKELTERLRGASPDQVFEIYLALDPALQRQAQYRMNHQLELLEKKKSLEPGSLQSGIAAMDVAGGGVRALVGGRDFNKSRFNRAVDANRQIGSLVKPFVYLTAMMELPETVPYQAQLVDDLPFTKRIDGRYWRPTNYDHKYLGRITWRKALAMSRNTPAIRIGESVGLEPVRRTLMVLRINNSPGTGPALFLGAVESSPLKMAAAYRAIAANGVFVKPYFIEEIKSEGKLIYKPRGGKQLFDKGKTDSMTSMLAAVMSEGTGKSVKKYNLETSMAGKTGTSNELHDGWFAGFSSELAMAVWVGRDSNTTMGYTGAASALPVWAQLMKSFGGDAENNLVSTIHRKNETPWLKRKKQAQVPPVKRVIASVAPGKTTTRARQTPLARQSYRYFD